MAMNEDRKDPAAAGKNSERDIAEGNIRGKAVQRAKNEPPGDDLSVGDSHHDVADGDGSENRPAGFQEKPSAVTSSPGSGRFLTQFLASLHHFASGCFGGLCMEYTSVAFPSFVKDPRAFQIPYNVMGIIVGFFYLGTILGFFLGGFVAHRYSKRCFLLVSYFPMAISWMCFMFVTNVPLMVATRVIQGIIYGACSNVGFAYVFEITDARSRNWALSLWALAITIGALLSAVFGSMLRWDHLAMVSAALTTAFFPLTFKMPDTPIYWLKKERDAKARQSLSTYRKANHNVDEELEEMKTYLSIAREDFSWRRLHQRKYAWPLAKTLLFNVCKPWMGYAILIGYTVDIFDRSYLKGPITPHTANIIAQVSDFFAQFSSTFVVSWVSRKVQMGVGSFGMALMNTLNGVYVYIAAQHYATHGTLDNTPLLSNLSTWWPVAGISAWFGIHSIGMANALHLFMTETLPQKVSSLGMAMCFMALTLNQFLVSTFYFPMLDAVGLHGVFWILAGSGYFLAVCSFILVKDTRNKTLLELERQHHKQQADPGTSSDIKPQDSDAAMTN